MLYAALGGGVLRGDGADGEVRQQPSRAVHRYFEGGVGREEFAWS